MGRCYVEQGAQLGACDDLGGGMGGGREDQDGGDIYIHIADSCCCSAETNNSVKQLYSNLKKKNNLNGILYVIYLLG